jgi:DNA-binding NarL/FixJ family response regulator
MSKSSNNPIKVVIIEDNRFIRDGLKIMLDDEQDMELVGSYPSCEDAFYYDDLINADVVIMDINLPGISGIEGVKYLKKNLPAIKVIICTAYEDDENVFEAIAAGAVGFLSKKASPNELIKTIKMVKQGGSPITPNVAAKIFSFLKKQGAKQTSIVLTETEKKILEKISLGKSYSAVAKELNETEEEILFLIRSIYGKLQMKLKQMSK